MSYSNILAYVGVGRVSITMTPSVVIIMEVLESTPSPSTMVYTFFKTSTVFTSPARLEVARPIRRVNIVIIVRAPVFSMA